MHPTEPPVMPPVETNVPMAEVSIRTSGAVGRAVKRSRRPVALTRLLGRQRELPMPSGSTAIPMIGEIGDGVSRGIAQRLMQDESCGAATATPGPKLLTRERTFGRSGDATPLIVPRHASSAAGE